MTKSFGHQFFLATIGLRRIELFFKSNGGGNDVSDHMRISRRRVMQMGVLAPLIALEARGADKGTIAAAAQQLAQIPDGTMGKLKEKAAGHCNKDENKKKCEGYKEDDFAKVVSCLWTYFSKGVTHGGARLPQDGDPKLDELMIKAYETRSAATGQEQSGNLIVSRIGKWENDYLHVTNYCVFRTGLHFAEVVGKVKGDVLKAYPIAFAKTQSEMTFIMDKVRFRNGTDSDDMARNLGGGC